MARTYDTYATVLGHFTRLSEMDSYNPEVTMSSNVVPFDKKMRQRKNIAAQYRQSTQPASPNNGSEHTGPVSSNDMAATMANSYEVKNCQPGPQMPFSPVPTQP